MSKIDEETGINTAEQDEEERGLDGDYYPNDQSDDDDDDDDYYDGDAAQRSERSRRKGIILVAIVGLVALIFMVVFGVLIYKSNSTPDQQSRSMSMPQAPQAPQAQPRQEMVTEKQETQLPTPRQAAMPVESEMELREQSRDELPPFQEEASSRGTKPASVSRARALSTAW